MSKMAAGDARDQLDVGLDLLLTAEGALYQKGGCSSAQVLAAAATIEQARKFIDPVREWLDRRNERDVRRMLRSGTGSRI